MFQRIMLVLNLVLLLSACFSLASTSGGDWKNPAGFWDKDPMPELLRQELAGGRIGGARLEAIVESLPHAVLPGIWEAPVFDPDERCWYLTGWIDDERAGCRRLVLTLTPGGETCRPRAWRFHLLCTGLMPELRERIEIEGAWRRDGRHLRMIWRASSNGRDLFGGPVVDTMTPTVHPGPVEGRATLVLRRTQHERKSAAFGEDAIRLPGGLLRGLIERLSYLIY